MEKNRTIIINYNWSMGYKFGQTIASFNEVNT